VESVVVHSAWAAEAVSRDLPELPVAVVNLTVADPGAVDRSALRERLGVRPDEVLMMHLGYLTPDKGLHDVLSGLSVARRMGGAARLMIVGEGEEHTVLHDAVDSLGLTPWVRFSGWVEPEEFCMLPAAADLGVVLRSPSAGETSAAVLRFLACGTPVAVTGLHQFLEWPEMAAPRITPGRSAGPDLARLLLDVADTDSWRRRRREARATYQGGHTPEIAARQLVEALRRTTAGR
jgi:glycosyltransferase involved in cell wall biosynthesis